MRCSNQIRGFWSKQTQSSYFACNLSVTAEIGPPFRKFKCERSIKNWVAALGQAESLGGSHERL